MGGKMPPPEVWPFDNLKKAPTYEVGAFFARKSEKNSK
jgi:hypothetical protein